MVTLIVAWPFPVPEAGEDRIQGVVSLTDQVSVPPPLFVMATVCGEGLLLPCCAVKVRLAGLKPMTVPLGCCSEAVGVTVSVTGTVTEGAPVGHSVTCPV